MKLALRVKIERVEQQITKSALPAQKPRNALRDAVAKRSTGADKGMGLVHWPDPESHICRQNSPQLYIKIVENHITCHDDAVKARAPRSWLLMRGQSPVYPRIYEHALQENRQRASATW